MAGIMPGMRLIHTFNIHSYTACFIPALRGGHSHPRLAVMEAEAQRGDLCPELRDWKWSQLTLNPGFLLFAQPHFENNKPKALISGPPAIPNQLCHSQEYLLCLGRWVTPDVGLSPGHKPHSSSVTLGKSFHLSGPPFAHL